MHNAQKRMQVKTFPHPRKEHSRSAQCNLPRQTRKYNVPSTF